jgi:hypothetical protein
MGSQGEARKTTEHRHDSGYWIHERVVVVGMSSKDVSSVYKPIGATVIKSGA